MNESQSIPEMLGFLGTGEARREFSHRQEAYSQLSYRAMYLLYEDEADDLLHEYAGTKAAAATAHPKINNDLALRYARDPAYRARIDGGYPEMDRQMRKAGLVPQEEQDIVDALNEIQGHSDE